VCSVQIQCKVCQPPTPFPLPVCSTHVALSLPFIYFCILPNFLHIYIYIFFSYHPSLFLSPITFFSPFSPSILFVCCILVSPKWIQICRVATYRTWSWKEGSQNLTAPSWSRLLARSKVHRQRAAGHGQQRVRLICCSHNVSQGFVPQ